MNRFFLLASILTFLPFSGSHSSDYACTVDRETSKTNSTFYCVDIKTQEPFQHSVTPIVDFEFEAYLKDKGVKIYDPEEYLGQLLDPVLYMSKIVGNLNNSCGQNTRVYYRPNEFDQLTPEDPVINRLKKIALSLHEAGVCDLPVIKANYRNLNIQNSDDVLQQFLCITNSESVFGKNNIGMGGRGAFGINPIHTTEDGQCEEFKNAVIRGPNGKEIKKNELYKSEKVIADNAKCALNLYKNNERGFRDWGTNQDKWGSNRHCSKTLRTRLNFTKHIGELACCSESCKNKVRGTI